MRVGFVGCGFTGDYYCQGLKPYPQLELVAVTDKDPERASQFCAFHSVKHAPTLDALLADQSIELIVNLTHSSSHFEVSKACLEAGKHVYSEKPLATTFSHARALVEMANAKGLYLSAAPCSLLGETAQTLWRALHNHEVGSVRAVYAELDDGPLQLSKPNLWRSPSGASYAYREEFEVGVTVEHAGYYLSWFAAFFGPAKTITTFASCTWPDKQMTSDEPLYMTTPDFTVACITFESGVVARLTCSLVGPYNHVLRIVGETGILSVNDGWNFSSPVYLDRYTERKFKAERFPITKALPFIANWLGHYPRTYPPVKKSSLRNQWSKYRMDYGRGIAELARAITEQRPPRLPSDFCLHVNELVLAIQNPTGAPYEVTTTFKRLEPMNDAALKQLVPAKW